MPLFSMFERFSRVLVPHDLPGQVGSVSIPKSYVVEFETADTLLAYPSGQSGISYRFTSISFTPKDGTEDKAADHVEESAHKKGYSFTRVMDKGVASYDQDSVEDGIPKRQRDCRFDTAKLATSILSSWTQYSPRGY